MNATTQRMAFRCRHSGLYYPPDYAKEWGRKYGIGLGPHPVSEILDTNYNAKIATCEVDPSRTMFPVGVTKGQLDFVMVTHEEYNANKAILAIDDPRMEKRAKIVQEKQKKNSPRLSAILNGVQE